MSRRDRIYRTTLTVLLWVLSLIVLLPLLLIVVNSLKSSAEADAMSLSMPSRLLFENFKTVLTTGDVFHSFLNSVLISCTSVILSVLLGSMAAFVLSRNRSKLNKAVYSYFLIGIVIPAQMITVIEVLKFFHLMNTYTGVILEYTAVFLPLSIFLAYSYVTSIPREMDEAAIVDGCGALRLFFTVMLPLVIPVVVTSCVTQFMFIWNDFQMPLYLLSDTTKWTLVLGIYEFMGQYSSDWNLVCAHIIISSLPVVLIYLFGQRYIISGMVSGAVKG
jgi:ABC-type sugar transport system, permease component